MIASLARAAWPLVLPLVLGGCATAPPFPAQVPTEVRACARLFENVDRLIDEAGVRDGGAARVPGMPYLRVDRLLASYRDALDPPGAFDFWIARLAALDRTARGFELANLPAARRALAPGIERLDACRERLVALDRSDPARRAHLLANAGVPDDYSTVRRVLGLYPLASIGFAAGQARWARDTAATLSEPIEALPVRGALARFVPPAVDGEAPAAPVSAANPLGLPLVDKATFAALVSRHAPVFEVDVASDDDRLGTPGFDAAGQPAVDSARATVTVRAAATRSGDGALLQIVYTAWFPARTMSAWYDLLGGRIDGLVWRVTLAPDGTPLVYDSIHPCGCFHMFFPGPRARPLPDVFAPRAFTPPGPGERIVLRLAAATHYIENVRVEAAGGNGTGYALAPDDSLRSVTRADGTRASLFGPHGRMPGTERLERFVFWPSGIAGAGAMRQWGRHPTAFVGRRHFDEPRAIESRFALVR